MHQENREKVELCRECGKSFFNKSQLNIHTRAVHEKIKNHLCTLCGKTFFNVKDMEMHVSALSFLNFLEIKKISIFRSSGTASKTWPARSAGISSTALST